jgi:hypothetical protein
MNTNTFSGPKRGRDYKGHPTRSIVWTFDSGVDSTVFRSDNETRGVRLEVEHDARRKRYTVSLQECGIHPYGFSVLYGRNGDRRTIIATTPCTRFSEKVFQALVDEYAPHAEALCRAYHEEVSQPV